MNRKRKWNQILGITTLEKMDTKDCSYTSQIRLDVKRSIICFSGLKPSKIRRRQEQLLLMLNGILNEYPFLHYYQGLHDVCAVCLNVYGEVNRAFQAAKRICLRYLRDSMHKSLDPVLGVMLTILPILKQEDRNVYRVLEECEIYPYFCLSWIITWFSHDVTNQKTVFRLFDFFLCQNPIMPVYLSAAVLRN